MLKAPIQMPDGRIEYPEKGTPQGGILSPLLANIYLHELDVWLASQWERMPTKHEYKEPPGRNGEPTRSKACRALRKNSRLKEIHHVRYADDFKIVCSNRDEAERIYLATQMWLKEELKLDISPEKSQITNLTVDYTEFLGFKIKAVLKKSKWIGVSYIADKAMKRIYGMLATQINKIGKHADLESRNKDIAKYNAMVMGVHNYYHVATGVYNSLSTISLRILRKLYTKTRTSGFAKTCSKPAICIPAAYRETKQIRYIGDYPVLPIGYCQTKNAVQQKNNHHPYAEENRHQLVAIQISKMWHSRTAWADRIAFAVNCISRYAAQQGKCAITGRFLMMDEAEGHHITPRYKGGTDDYENIVILSPEIHLLIKVTKQPLIYQMLSELKLNKKQLKKLNDLRSKYGTAVIV